MKFVLEPVDMADAAAISRWTYAPPYDFYNMEASEESVKELLGGSYWVVKSPDGDVVGFYCTGESAQVPAGKAFGAYPTDTAEVVDIGIGMRPDLTGMGLGTEFLAVVLCEVCRKHPAAGLRLTVATFNRRAIKLYERFGFRARAQFDYRSTAFQTMARPLGACRSPH